MARRFMLRRTIIVNNIRTFPMSIAFGIASPSATTQFLPRSVPTALAAVAISAALVAGSAYDALVPASVQPPLQAPAWKRVERLALIRETTVRPVRFVEARTVAGLVATFEDANFTLPAVRGGKPVPRLFVKAVPADIRGIKQTSVKKSVFLRTALPLILQVNESILRDRARLKALAAGLKARTLSSRDRLWIAALAKRFGVETPTYESLLARVDIVPPSLALAQAVVESSWGTSAAARRGNALFGQMVYGPGTRGIVVMQGNVRARIAHFDSLLEATRAYIMNLNTHFAYKEFRERRAKRRASGQALSGHDLAGTLLRYSELGLRYVRYIQGAIRIERLGRFDAARLRS